MMVDLKQPAWCVAGPNATAADLHHLPFAEASLGHKPRKGKPSSGPEEADEAAGPDTGAFFVDKGVDFLQQQAPTLAANYEVHCRMHRASLYSFVPHVRRLLVQHERGNGVRAVVQDHTAWHAALHGRDIACMQTLGATDHVACMQDLADADWSIWRPLVTALRNAFVAEDSERQMLRRLLSFKAPVQDEAAP